MKYNAKKRLQHYLLISRPRVRIPAVSPYFKHLQERHWRPDDCVRKVSAIAPPIPSEKLRRRIERDVGQRRCPDTSGAEGLVRRVPHSVGNRRLRSRQTTALVSRGGLGKKANLLASRAGQYQARGYWQPAALGRE